MDQAIWLSRAIHRADEERRRQELMQMLLDPAAAAAAMAAIEATGTDLRLYSNFLPAAALQQIQQHREQLMMNHQRANSDNDDRDDTPAPNSNDVDVEEDTQGDSEGK